MSQREGHATGGAAPPARPADAPPSASRPGPSRTRTDTPPSTASNLHCPPGPLLPGTESEPARLLRQILAAHLPPASLAQPVAVHDSALDGTQRDAVARAVQSTDVFLIEGPAGTGKTRVVIEVVRQVADRGGRVLWLSPHPAALDVRLPAVAALAGLSVVRRLGPDEVVEQLPSAVAALTPARRANTIRDSLFRRAAEAVAAAERRFEAATRVAPTADELATVNARQAAGATERQVLAARRISLEADVTREADSASDGAGYFVQRVRRAAAAHAKRTVGLDATVAELATTRREAEDRRRTAEAVCVSLRPRSAALAAGRWYAPAFWRARFDGSLAARLADAETRLAAASTALAELIVREQKLTADRRLADDEHAAERARLVEAEVARRRADLDARIVEIDRAAAADRSQADRLVASLRQAGIDPTDGPTTVSAERDAARRALESARAWKTEVDTRADEMVEEACRAVNVVAGPIKGIADAPDLSGPFDLLVVDDADRVTEPDLVAAAPLAERWLLAGGLSAPAGRSRKPAPDLFGRLTAALRHEVWGHEGPRLVCRLSSVRGTDRRRLECEPVADAADIELRLFTPPGGEPTLAEVAFPERFTPTAAREYLVRELAEVTCQPCRRTGEWHSTPEGSVLRFHPADPSAVLAEVGPGVREELSGLETCAVHFSADWTPERARDWVAEHVGRRDSGRLVVLSNPYRACPGLARWLNRAFATGFAVNPAGDEGPHVEFLAVPDTDPRRRNGARPGRVGGAGYEIDLADARQRAALPADLGELPAAGFVNVPEAQALVRYLEPRAGPGVAVTSPFPAQVALLRRLLARSPRLAAVQVLDPSDVAADECDLLAVSLTRSHVARAVPFGDTPAVLAGLLGRARKKVLFAGDPGTLARRLQWEGPVDHLDAADAARERGWVAALADCPRVAAPRRRDRPGEGTRS